MDSRHELREQEMFNEIIHFINKYIRENVDEIVTHELLRANIINMTKRIYSYAQMPVDVDDMLSKKNCLSFDTVPLPVIDEMFFSNEEMFNQIVNEIETMSNKDSSIYLNCQDFHNGMLAIISKY